MKLLIAVDGSPASQAAIDEVAARRWPAGTEARVIAVVEPPHLWAVSEAMEQVDVRAHALIATSVATLQRAQIQATGAVLIGDPKRVILDEAATTRDLDFIVVGSHGSSAVARFLLGNVASAVLRYAPCSVLVVRQPSPGGAKRILLAVDGSEGSAAAARSLAARPWPQDVAIRALSVVDLVLPPVHALLDPPFLHPSDLEQTRADAMRDAEKAVDQATGILGPAISTSISVLLGGPQSVILKEAEDWHPDLIVLGSHGRKGLDRFLLGSVSEAVAAHASCSVEVIRPRAAA